MKASIIYKIAFIVCIALWSAIGHSQVYLDKAASIRFFSSTPIEDIEAKSKSAAIAFNRSSNKIFAKVAIKSFKFKSGLMEEHFNENYMESDKYPSAEFDGLLVGEVDYSKDGEKIILAKGKLTIHNVTKEREIPTTMTIKDGKISAKSVFKIKPQDYNIEIPKLVLKNIAEEIEVTILTNLEPKK